MKLIDISQDMLSAPIYPGDPKPKVQHIRQIAQGQECNLTAYSAGSHTGTHVDAPLHFIEGGAAVDECPLVNFIGPCMVITVQEGPITGEWVNNHFPRNCERLLVKSGGKAWFMDSAAMEAAELGIQLIGTDSLSIGCSGAQIKPHKAFLSNHIAILEGLALHNVAPGNYFLFAPPIKLGGLEGAPARAVLIEDYIFWGGKTTAAPPAGAQRLF